MIKLEPVHQCPLCKSLRKNIVYERLEDRLFKAEGEWTFVSCISCGLVFLDPRPALKDLHKTYTLSYSLRKKTAPSGPENLRPSLRRRIRNAYLRRFHNYLMVEDNPILSYIPFLVPGLRAKVAESIFCLDFVKGGRLLDIGCGTGDFVHHMATLGWKTEGIDTDSRAVQICKNRNLNVKVGLLEEQNYPNDYFDAIVLKHVIEHVPNPIDLLIQCRRILKPGGKILLLTPNINSTTHKIFGRHWLGLDVSRHLFLFSFSTISRLIEKTGLQCYSRRSTSRISQFVWTASHLNRDFEKSIYQEEPSRIQKIKCRIFMVLLRIELLFNDSVGDELEVVATKT
jgi:2-polyprenyl-3-methyl-5-hydroxy-6-metoxy-1,4-benzoquinol methylase